MDDGGLLLLRLRWLAKMDGGLIVLLTGSYVKQDRAKTSR